MLLLRNSERSEKMRALAASTLFCCLLLAGEAEGEYQDPD